MLFTRRVLVFATSVLVVANARAVPHVVHVGCAVPVLVVANARAVRHALHVVAHLVAVWLQTSYQCGSKLDEGSYFSNG